MGMLGPLRVEITSMLRFEESLWSFSPTDIGEAEP